MTDLIQKALDNPALHDLLSILKSGRNGFVYGARIRFSHALVLSLLFKSGPLLPRLKHILKATKQHGEALGMFAIVYKSILYIFKILRCFEFNLSTNEIWLNTKKLNQPRFLSDIQNKKNGFEALIAGTIGGYFIFGKTNGSFKSALTDQIVLYIFSRITIGTGKILAIKLSKIYKDFTNIKSTRRQVVQKIGENSNTVFASLCWGIVMYYYRKHPHILQRSLGHSMDFIYEHSEHWTDLKTFLFQSGTK